MHKIDPSSQDHYHFKLFIIIGIKYTTPNTNIKKNSSLESTATWTIKFL